MTCELTSTEFRAMEPVFVFDDTNGDLIIKTQTPSLDGMVYNYAIECISELSLEQNLPAIQNFVVEYAFEDCQAQILLNGASVEDQTQFFFARAAQTEPFTEYF